MTSLALLLAAACRSDRELGHPSAVSAPPPSTAAPVDGLRDEPKRDEGAALPVWRALMDGGCRIDAGGPLWTPIEAQILEATPLAIHGKDFEEPELRAYFSKDGNWYTPVSGQTGVALSADEQACVDRVRVRREQLSNSRPVPPEFIRLLLGSPHLLSDHWRFALESEDPFRNATVTREGTQWTFRADLPCTKEDFECHYLALHCDPVEPDVMGICWGGRNLKE